MKQFNAGLACGTYANLMQLAEKASMKEADSEVPQEWRDRALQSLSGAKVLALVLGLTETDACIKRFNEDFETEYLCKDLHYGLMHLLQLMQSELEKRKVFAIEQEKTKYYRDEIWGVVPPFPSSNALIKAPPPLFSERAEKAFPTAYMDIVEAGRCLALDRNNAAVYHLVCVAEVGLRALAWDRRVKVKQHRVFVPLEMAQWGEIIAAVAGKVDKIKKWRASLLREEAIQFYHAALTELRAFNDGWRRHVAHARANLYEPDEAMALWGHVYRFMNTLSERISETKRTPNVWRKETPLEKLLG